MPKGKPTMDINISDVDKHAVQYIIDLIERDEKANQGNSIRGYSLFQAVGFLKYLLKQELSLAEREERSPDEQDTEKHDYKHMKDSLKEKKPFQKESFESAFDDMAEYFSKVTGAPNFRDFFRN